MTGLAIAGGPKGILEGQNHQARNFRCKRGDLRNLDKRDPSFV
jgi:hypothetical protein